MVNEKTNFLFIDDLYTNGSTLFGVINFIEKAFYSNSNIFKTCNLSKNGDKFYCNFYKLKGIFFF